MSFVFGFATAIYFGRNILVAISVSSASEATSSRVVSKKNLREPPAAGCGFFKILASPVAGLPHGDGSDAGSLYDVMLGVLWVLAALRVVSKNLREPPAAGCDFFKKSLPSRGIAARRRVRRWFAVRCFS